MARSRTKTRVFSGFEPYRALSRGKRCCPLNIIFRYNKFWKRKRTKKSFLEKQFVKQVQNHKKKQSEIRNFLLPDRTLYKIDPIEQERNSSAVSHSCFSKSENKNFWCLLKFPALADWFYRLFALIRLGTIDFITLARPSCFWNLPHLSTHLLPTCYSGYCRRICLFRSDFRSAYFSMLS